MNESRDTLDLQFVENVVFSGLVKTSGCKTREILQDKAYVTERRNDTDIDRE